MGDAQMRVAFDFSGAREVHYISADPEVGDFVTHLRELWVVRKIEEDASVRSSRASVPSRKPAPELNPLTFL
jgi:hypothetical protein